MQNLKLSRIQYTQLDATTWCATADVSSMAQPTHAHNLSPFLTPRVPAIPHSSNANKYNPLIDLSDIAWQYVVEQKPVSAHKDAQNKRQQQRVGVRLLLQQLLLTLDIDDTLDESQFPYQLSEHRYYVCFSHSGDRSHSKVAVAISYRRAVGIDIETHDVEWHVAQRFYHSDEISKLNLLPAVNRPLASKLLWQVKESFIKVHQYTLAQGLGMNYAPVISDLDIKADSAAIGFSEHPESGYQIVFSPTQQVIIVF